MRRQLRVQRIRERIGQLLIPTPDGECFVLTVCLSSTYYRSYRSVESEVNGRPTVFLV